MENEDNIQRVLIFQGGGALGAYEAGVYKGLYEWFIELDKKYDRDNKPLFDIVAGTSIGSINAAILTSYVKENKTFEGSAEHLINFWKYLSTESSIDKNSFFYNWWSYVSSINKKISSAESARRYYTTKEFIFTGVPNVFKPPKPQFDYKFLDAMNILYQCDNKPLKESLEKFAKFPIATSFDNNEPRLILLSVDVQEGIPIVFDSYETEDGTRKSEYVYFGKNVKFNKQEKHEYVVRYDDGVKSDFVMASSSYPINFPYTELEVEERITAIDNSLKEKSTQSTPQKIRKITKYFWDGGIMINTPLKEVLVLHGRYWSRVKKSHDIPPLRICIVNLHPINHDSVPFDMDGIIERKNDLLYHDKTEFDELASLLISDYVTLSQYFIDLAEKNGISRDLIEILLAQKCRSLQWIGNQQNLTYGDLLKGKPKIDFITRIQRKNDPDEIANKVFDFSIKTLTKLINDGYKETMEQTPGIEKEFLEQLNEVKKQREEFNKREEDVRKKLLGKGKNNQTTI
ncbi:MAG: patatin-like phospholipase family protein [Nitrososphaeraceae archaeon]|nr:patatin-like phospholipase family protein [Nitrososphaeraceae archaeon]